MSDPARIAAMTARTDQRKAKNRAANEARAEANMRRLTELGGTRAMYERVTVYTVWWPTPKIMRDVRERSRMKLESPGTAVARTLRERAA